MNSDFDIIAFYKEYVEFDVKDMNSSGEIVTRCPFHEDTTPSLSINLRTGLWKCFAPHCGTNALGNGGGDIYRFYAEANETTIEEARSVLGPVDLNNKEETEEEAKDEKKPPPIKNFPITEEQLEERHQAFITNPEKVERAADRFHWTLETLKKWQLGYEDGVIWIPIREHGRLVNIRKYRPACTDGNKVSSVAGFGKARLWPFENLEEQEIFIFEGEKDCILANQMGLNAVTVTSGAGAWNNEWLPLFANKKISICYDIDEAGQKGAAKIAGIISKVARDTRIVTLPLTTPQNADFTDYVLASHTIQDFLRLVEAAPQVNPPDTTSIQIDESVHDTTLQGVLKDHLFYKRAKMKVRVIGKSDRTFMIPKKVRITCNRDNGSGCLRCGLYGTADQTLLLNEAQPSILEFLTSATKDARRLYREVFDLAPCRQYHVQEIDHQFIEDVQITPTVDDIAAEEQNTEIFGQQCFKECHMYFLNQHLDVNYDYEVETIMFKHPSDNHIVHIGYKVNRCQTSLEEFKLTDDIKQQLRKFQCPELKPS